MDFHCLTMVKCKNYLLSKILKSLLFVVIGILIQISLHLQEMTAELDKYLSKLKNDSINKIINTKHFIKIIHESIHFYKI